MKKEMTNKEISAYLHEVFDLLADNYDEPRLLGVFVTGIVNYGFSRKIEDLELTAIYLPSFEELCCAQPIDEDFDGIRVIDIRLMYDVAINDKWDSLELLFSNYRFVNPTYKGVFNESFVKHREIIAKISPKIRVTKSFNMMKQAIAEENWFEVARIDIAITMYLNGESCDDCYHLPSDYHRFYLQAVIDGEYPVDAEKLLNKMIGLTAKTDDTFNSRGDMLIKQAVVAIMNLSLVEKISYDIFRDCLTSLEEKALISIYKAINGESEGNIVVSTLVSETGISRPVYKSLFVKLERENVAKLENGGAAGMRIVFLTNISGIRKYY